MHPEIDSRKLDPACAILLVSAGTFMNFCGTALAGAPPLIWSGLGVLLLGVGTTWLLGDWLRLW